MTGEDEPSLPTTDTPPQSPGEFCFSHSNRRIHIDEHGVHDFDFKKRHLPVNSRKLQKSSRHNQKSISSMTDIPQRTPSDGSDCSSIRKRFSLLLPGRNEKHKDVSFHPPIEPQDDPLPNTKKELEMRLNYHLSELDLLKKTVNMANDLIRQHADRLEILQARSANDMLNAMRSQAKMVDQARVNRDSYVQFVAFHRRQLERIRRKRVEMEIGAGLEPTLPEVYKQIWTDEDWGRLFMI